MTSTIKNNLQEILSKKGYPKRRGHFVMSDEFHSSIGISSRRFNKIVDNEEDMTLTELHAIASKLGMEAEELYETKDTSTPDNVAGLNWTK